MSHSAEMCIECGDSYLLGEPWSPRCWNCWRYARHRNAVQVETTKSFLRDILKLTHPDHHPSERADMANRVTATVIAWMKGVTS